MKTRSAHIWGMIGLSCLHGWLALSSFLCQNQNVYFGSEPFAIGPVQFRWPRGVAENSFTKPGFWEHFVGFFPRKNSKTQSSLNLLQSGPRKFSKSDFSGLAPIRRVLIGHWICVCVCLRGSIYAWLNCKFCSAVVSMINVSCLQCVVTLCFNWTRCHAYHWIENHYITSRYFSELITFDVM